MIHPTKLSLLNTYGKIGFYFMQYFPFILVIPASFSFLKDKDNQTMVYVISRVGRANYYYGKIISVFLMTFLAFSIPLFLELLLNLIAFPAGAAGDQSGVKHYDLAYIQNTGNYLFAKIWKISPYLYSILFTIMLSSVASSFSVFTTALSMTKFTKYKVMVLLPVYLLLTIINAISTKFNANIKYTFYLMSHDTVPKMDCLYLVIAALLILISFILIKAQIKRELE